MAETQKVKKGNKLAKFFKETKAELKKVTWPGKNQLVHNTLIILAFIVVSCIVLTVCDTAFSWLLSLATKLL